MISTLTGGVIVGHLFIKRANHLDASDNSKLDNIGAGWYPVPEGEISSKPPLYDLMLTLGLKRGFWTRAWGVSLEGPIVRMKCKVVLISRQKLYKLIDLYKYKNIYPFQL